MGPSGSGKTALLSLIAGLVPAERGEILIGGVPLSDADGGRAARAHGVDGPEAACLRRLGAGQRGARTRRRADGAGGGRDALRGARRRRPGPPRRSRWGRAAAACRAARRCGWRWRACAAHPDADLLLVDEPTAHLDSETAERVVEALMQLARGRTLIVATHDPVLAARMGRVIRLDELPVREAA